MIAEDPETSTSTHAATVATWIRGWAASRALGAPVASAQGWRVEVGLPQQRRRHVFAQMNDELRALGRDVREPWVYLKCCATREALAAALPPRWAVQPRSSMMVFDGPPPAAGPLPAGYLLDIHDDLAGAHVRVLAEDGSLAADGRVVIVDGHAVFDRIGTHADHRRRGLGRALMGALHALAQARDARHGLLVATIAGEALYSSLGWRVHAPYASAVIVAEDEASSAH